METSVFRPRRAALSGSRRLLAAAGDDRLAEQIRRGNDAAFEVVYDRHHRAILAFCRQMLGSRDEAEDAVQQTFASAYSALRSNEREIRLKAWLYTIARNRCLSILRARREQPAELDDQATAGLSEQVEQRADLRDLLDDLRELPSEQREALVLFELGDLSHAEIAGVIGVEPMKVKALVFQARSTLIENRDARAIPCAEIREELATATGGALRRGPLRRHLKACRGCREYRDHVGTQRRALALLLPVVPTAGLKEAVLAAIGCGGGGGAGGAGLASGGAASAVAGSAGGGGGLFASLAGAGGAKLAVAAAVAGGTIAGGGIVAEHAVVDDPGAQSAQAAENGGGSATSGGAPATRRGQSPGTGAANTRPVDDAAGEERAAGSEGGSDLHGEQRRGERGDGARRDDHRSGEDEKQERGGGGHSAEAPRGARARGVRRGGKSRARKRPHVQRPSVAAAEPRTRADTRPPTRSTDAEARTRGGKNGPGAERSSAAEDIAGAAQDRLLSLDLPH